MKTTTPRLLTGQELDQVTGGNKAAPTATITEVTQNQQKGVDKAAAAADAYIRG